MAFADDGELAETRQRRGRDNAMRLRTRIEQWAASEQLRASFIGDRRTGPRNLRRAGLRAPYHGGCSCVPGLGNQAATSLTPCGNAAALVIGHRQDVSGDMVIGASTAAMMARGALAGSLETRLAGDTLPARAWA